MTVDVCRDHVEPEIARIHAGLAECMLYAHNISALFKHCSIPKVSKVVS